MRTSISSSEFKSMKEKRFCKSSIGNFWWKKIKWSQFIDLKLVDWLSFCWFCTISYHISGQTQIILSATLPATPILIFTLLRKLTYLGIMLLSSHLSTLYFVLFAFALDDFHLVSLLLKVSCIYRKMAYIAAALRICDFLHLLILGL